jgi:predicted  nucleic acid-binding Zn-ribbon protein
VKITMTQTQPDRIDQLESIMERMDRKLDAISNDLVEIKISQARTDERFNGIDQRLSTIETQASDFKKSVDTQFADIKKSTDTQFADIKIQLRAQDSRLWTFISALVLAVVGLLTRFLFFPQV